MIIEKSSKKSNWRGIFKISKTSTELFTYKVAFSFAYWDKETKIYAIKETTIEITKKLYQRI